MTTQEVSYAEVPLERLEHEIATLAAHINAATCRWLQMVAEFDRREGWVTWGTKNCAEWLAYRCGLSYRAARDQVRVAGRLVDLPLITEAFAKGTLSYSKVRTLVRVARAETEKELLGIAADASAAQLALLLGAYRRVSDEDEVERADRRYRERSVGWSYDEDEMVTITLRLPPEQGELVLKALDAAAEEIRSDLKSAGTAVPAEDSEVSFVQAAADGLVLMAEGFLAAGDQQHGAGDRYQVMVHVDLETLRSDVEGRSEVEGVRVTSATARRLACDASLVTSIEKAGEVLSVGRRTRSIPTATRRALKARDRGCRFPGCHRQKTDAHHIEHWAHGGETKLSNLIELCCFHHRFVHEGGYRAVFTEKGVDFISPEGRRIGTAAPSTGDADILLQENARNGLEIGADTIRPWSGDPLDLDHGIHGLLSMDADLTRRKTELRHRLN